MHRITTSPPPSAERVPFLISRRYAFLWSGQLVSRLGDTVFQTTVVLWIATRLATGLSWAPLAVGAVFLAGQLPEILVGPLAGVYVDRWDRRRTMLVMDMTRACLVALLIVVASGIAGPFLPLPSRVVNLGVIYAAIALIAAASWFFIPARIALIGDVVEDRFRERASGLAQTGDAVVTIVGPAVAAPLFFAIGPGWTLTADSLSFLISFAAVWLVQAPSLARDATSQESGNVPAELMEGVRVLLSSGILRALLVAGVLISIGFAAMETLAIFFLRQNLHASASLYGLLGGAQGAGALVGAALGGPLAERIGVGRLLWRSAILLGLLFVLFSRLTSVAPALAVLFLVGAAFAVMEVSESPLLLRATPRAYLGRVSALLFPTFGVASAVAAVAAGWLAGALRGLHLAALGITLGPLDAVIAASGLLVIAGGIYTRGQVIAPTTHDPAPNAGG